MKRADSLLGAVEGKVIFTTSLLACIMTKRKTMKSLIIKEDIDQYLRQSKATKLGMPWSVLHTYNKQGETKM